MDAVLFQSPDILYVIAEVSVTITGFTAIAAVFRRRQTGWDSAERIMFEVLISTSLIVLFFSFLPWMLGQVLDSNDMVWRVSCGLYGVAQLIDVAVYLRKAPKKPSRGQSILAPLGFVNMTCQFIVALGWITNGQLVFVAGLLFLMYVSIHNFVLLLVIGIDKEKT